MERFDADRMHAAYAVDVVDAGGRADAAFCRVNMISNLVYQLGFASFNFPFAATLCVAGLALTIAVLSILRLAARPFVDIEAR